MRSVLLAVILFVAAPLGAQEQRAVFLYDVNCATRYDDRVSVPGAWQMALRGNTYGVRGIPGSTGSALTITPGDSGARPATITRTSTRPSVRTVVRNVGGRCEMTSERIATDELLAWAGREADAAERNQRYWTRVRNVLFATGIVVVAGTAAYASSEIDRNGEVDATTFLAGGALGITISVLGATQAQPEVSSARQQRDKYRAFERWIVSEGR